MTIADYARRRGCARNSVLRAIDQGRLRESVGVTHRGHRVILDPDLADDEWSRSAQYRRPSNAPANAPVKAANRLIDLREEREAEALRRDRIKTAQAELDLAQQRGELVRVDDVRAEVNDAFATVRTRLLAIPSRCAQQIPHLTAADVGTLDDFIREALEALANERGE